MLELKPGTRSELLISAKMNHCIIVDLETTEEENPKVNEVGAVLYSVKHQCVVGCYSSLVSTNSEGLPGVPNTISQIDPIAVEYYGICPRNLVQKICDGVGVLESSGYFFVAHNVEHEQQYLNYPNWLCTYRDFDLFPKNYVGKRDLFSMAIANGVGISQGHRAIYDCLLIAEIFNRRKDLKADFEYAQLPFLELIAAKDDITTTRGYRWDYTRQGWFSKDFGDRNDPENQIRHLMISDGPRIKVRVLGGYEIRDIAKSWGFQWDAEGRYWHKLVNPEAVELYPFPLAVVEEG
jgi:DNA polymerase-3 subunit epsilon